MTVATVVFCGRTFRADDEPTAPARPAWRLTGGTTSSAVMAGFFVLQGLSTALALTAGDDDGAAVAVISAVVYAALAAAYVVSAAKQRARRLRAQNTSSVG